MTKYYIDTSTPNDFDAVVRFLLKKQIPIVDRNKVKLVVSADLKAEQLEELRKLSLEESISCGTSPLP